MDPIKHHGLGIAIVVASAAGLATVSIATIAQQHDTTSWIGRQLYSGGLANLCLSILVFFTAVVPLRRHRGWAVLVLFLLVLVYALPLFPVNSTWALRMNAGPFYWIYLIALFLLIIGLAIAATAPRTGIAQTKDKPYCAARRIDDMKDLEMSDAIKFLASYRADVEKSFHERISFFLVAQAMLFAGFGALVAGDRVDSLFRWAFAVFGFVLASCWSLVTIRQSNVYRHTGDCLENVWPPYKLIRNDRPEPKFFHAMSVLRFIPFTFMLAWGFLIALLVREAY